MMAEGFFGTEEIEPAGEDLTQSLAGVRIAIDARQLRLTGVGTARYLRAGIELLIGAGADVSLLANFAGGEIAKDFPGARWEAFGSRRDIIWDQFNLPRHLRKRSFQYYWAPGNNGIPWWPTGATRKVCTTHDIIPLRLPRMYLYGSPLFALSYFVSTLSGILRSDILLTVSEASARDIFRAFRKSATVIPPDLSLRVKVNRSGHLPHDLSGSDYLIYTGGLGPHKNLKNLLAAFALSLQRIPDLRLVITGRKTQVLEPVIAALNLTNHVVLTGFVSDQEMGALLEGARALVYPSLYEGFGLPILEAFAADIPVVTCRNSSLLEVAGDAAIYVDPLSPASIADGMVAALQQDVAEKQRALGRLRLKRFEPLVARRQLIDIFATDKSTRYTRSRWQRVTPWHHTTH